MLFDTHAHLDDPQLVADLPSVIERAQSTGVIGILAVATTSKSAATCVRLAERFGIVYAAVGVQPNYVGESADQDWDEIVVLSQHPRVRAIGETGLDHYWNYAPLDVQKKWFHRHIQLAMQTGLPLVIHMREPQGQDDGATCARDILDCLVQNSGPYPLQGIMHSFTGSVETAMAALELGLHISFAGMLTYKKSAGLRDIAARIPLDRLLIETDAPYLPPHPHRGRRPNEPELICCTARCLADVREVSYDEICRITTANAQRLLGTNGSKDLSNT